MSRKLTLTLVSCMLMLFTQSLFSQPCPPGTVDPTATICEDACWLCTGEIDGYSNTVPSTSNPTGPDPLCGGGFVPNNTQWLAFVAGSTNLTLSIDVGACSGGSGLQAGIISSCENLNSSEVVCSGACPGPDPVVLSTNGLTVNAVYFLWFDGCAGASCDYTVTLVAGDVSADPAGPTLPINGPATGCPNGDPQTYTTFPVMGASVYDWTITPAAPFMVSPDGLSIIVTWPAAGIYTICVDAYNDCFPATGPTQCFTVNVTEPTPTDINPVFYCPEDPGWLYPNNGMFYPEQGGIPHEVVWQTAGGCDSSVFIYPEAWVTEPGYIDTALCFGECLFLDGAIYCNPLMDVEIPLNNFQTVNGCDSSVVVNLEIVRPMITGFSIPQPLNCANSSSGTIIFAESPQFADINATWEWTTVDGFICGADNDPILFACDTGMYVLTLTLTDINGYVECQVTDSVFLFADLMPPTLSSSATIANCGNSDGTATVIIMDATNPTVLWDTNAGSQITETAIGLAAGSYWVTVTGENGCVDSLEVPVPGSPPITILPDVITNVDCNGNSTGEASVTVVGAADPITVVWNPGGLMGTSVTGLAADVYTVVVTDNNGCTSDTTITITEPPLFELDAVVVVDSLDCNGDGDASAMASAMGGTPPYSFLWSVNTGSQGTALATGLSADTYMVTITDFNGCMVIGSITITEPSEVIVDSVLPGVPVSCNGDTNGTATASGSGGTPPISYEWSANAGGQMTATATGLGADTYMVTVSDAKGCEAVGSITIIEPSLVVMDSVVQVLPISCSGDMNGSATAYGSGGTAPLTYEWSANAGSQMTATATGLGADTYIVTVTDNNNCTAVGSITITEPTPVVMDNVVQNLLVQCNGDSNGSATASGSGGTPPLTYEWSANAGSQMTATATGLGAGVYMVTVTDDNNCTAVGSITITEPTPVVMDSVLPGMAILCNGDTNGTATASGSGGTPPLTYEWSANAGSQMTATATGLGADTYMVTVTDDNNCTAVGSITIIEPTPVVMDNVVLDSPVLCNGDSNASATASGSGGTPPLTYQWGPSAGSQMTATANGLGVGIHMVTVTDDNNCTAVGSITIIQPPLLVMDSVLPGTPVQCTGDNNGTATASGSGGTPPLSYEWSANAGSQMTATATGLGVDTYTVTVTDGNNCTAVGTITITGPPALVIDSVLPGLPISCNGDTDGTATASGSGGTPPLSYEWSANAGSQMTATATGLGADTYMVTVTDDNNCTAVGSITITEPTPVVMDNVVQNLLVQCNGDSNGSATANGSGGTPPLTYEWSANAGSQMTATATGLGADTYMVTVTDDNNCTAVGSITITEPTPVVMDNVVQNLLVQCNGDSNGSATASGSGGTPPLTYEWSTNAGGQMTATATGLGADTYLVTVSDDNNCTAVGSITITEPTPVVMDNVIAGTAIRCNGDTDGTAIASGSGGTPPLTFEWSANAGSQMTATATGLGADTYMVTVTDDNDCTAVGSIIITEPTPVQVALIDSEDLKCFGDANGSATVEGSGGTAPYSYEWDAAAGSQMTPTANGLIAGNYSVTVTDGLGCMVDMMVTLTEPTAPLSAVTDAVVDVTCGTNNGSIAITVSGGTGTIYYLWDVNAGSQMTATATGLGVGTFSVTITDDNNCELIYSETVSTPSNFKASLALVDSVTCNGLSDGNIYIDVTGGTMPYTFNWDPSTAPTLEDQLGVPAGAYSLTVTDFDGCELTLSTNVGEPAALSTSVATTLASCGESNGSINLTVEGGNPPYNYVWDGGAGMMEDPSMLTRGTYNVTVTDRKGCSIIESATIEEPNGPSLTFTQENVKCNSESTGSIDLTVTGGTMPFTFDWSTGAPAPPTEDPTGLPAGIYSVVVTDVNSCSIDATITITEESALTAVIDDFTAATCGISNGSVNVTIGGGVGPYTYLWNGTIMDEDPIGLPNGNYTLVATDANDCTISISQQLVEPGGMVFEPTVQTNVSCFGGIDGDITVTLTGGKMPYSYVWDPPQGNINNPSGLSSGVYLLTVTDDDGCPLEGSYTITEPMELTGMSFPRDATCANDDGEIAIQVQGGTAAVDYSYNWTGPGTFTSANQNITGLAMGTYDLTITDDNNCEYVLSETIGIPDAPTALLTTTNVDCFGNSTGVIALATSGGTMPYTYNWSGGIAGTDDPVANGVPMGTYSVTVTDSKNCTFVLDNIDITQPTLLTLTGTTTLATCNANNGTATSDPVGGTMPYTYAWSNGLPSTPNQIDLGVGNYTLTVSDAMDCTAEFVFMVESPDPITITTNHDDVTCNGGTNGNLYLNIMGGAPPFTYAWDNGAGMDQNPTNLTANTYNVTITDVNSCTFVASETITEPTAIVVTTLSKVEATCGVMNGAIDIMVTGGTGPYTFLWQDAGSANVTMLEDPSGLAPGTYYLTVTDFNNCTMTYDESVTTPNQLEATSTFDPVRCFGESNGGIVVTPTGGAPGGFTFTWSDSQYDGLSTLVGIPAGPYTVTITDTEGCTFSVLTTVTQPDALTEDAQVPLQVACNGEPTGSALIVVGGGTLPYDYDWENNAYDGQFDVAGLPAGIYKVLVTDGNGCEIESSFEITEPPLLESSSAGSDANCFGVADGSIDVFPTGGTAPFTYEWTGGLDPVQNPDNVPAGTYTVTVTDDNGCTTTNTVDVGQPTRVELAVESVSNYEGFNVSCSDSFDGSATVSSSGGTGPYTYLWQDSTTGPSVTDIGAGDFLVTVTDALGCEENDLISLTAPAPVEVNLDFIPVRCNGDQNGMIFVDDASGGAAPYVYSIDGGTLGSGVFPSLTAGWYEIAAEDSNGCGWADSIWMPEPDELRLEIGDEIEILYGDSINIFPEASVGVSLLDTFIWSTPGGDVLCINPDDSICWDIKAKPELTTLYSLMIRDQNNCVTEDKILVRVKKERLIYIPSGFSPNGDMQNDEFLVYAGRGVEKVHSFNVFDRWGEIVYSQSDYDPKEPQPGWDGSLGGILMNPGVFVYTVEVEFTDGEIELYTGDVTLWR